jgi:hypothetical protein
MIQERAMGAREWHLGMSEMWTKVMLHSWHAMQGARFLEKRASFEKTLKIMLLRLRTKLGV